MLIIIILFLLIIAPNIHAAMVGPADLTFACSCTQEGGEECGYQDDGSGGVLRNQTGARERLCCKPAEQPDGTMVDTYCADSGDKRSPGLCCPLGQAAGVPMQCGNNNNQANAGNNQQQQQLECDPIITCCGDKGKRKSEITGDECCTVKLDTDGNPVKDAQGNDQYDWASTDEECCQGKLVGEAPGCKKCVPGNATPVAMCQNNTECNEDTEKCEDGCCVDKCGQNSKACKASGDCGDGQKCGANGCCEALCQDGQTTCKNDADCNAGGDGPQMTCSIEEGESSGCCTPMCPNGYVYCTEDGCVLGGGGGSGSSSSGSSSSGSSSSNGSSESSGNSGMENSQSPEGPDLGFHHG